MVVFVYFRPPMINIPPIDITNKTQLRQLELNLLHYLEVVRLALSSPSQVLEEQLTPAPIATLTPRGAQETLRALIRRVIDTQRGQFKSSDIYKLAEKLTKATRANMAAALYSLVKAKVVRVVEPSHGAIPAIMERILKT